MDRINKLRTELTTDLLRVGYAGMTDVQASVSLNDTGKGRTLAVDTLSPAVIYEAISASEFDALTAAQKTSVRDILSLGGEVILTEGSRARAVLVGIFPAGSATRAAIVAKVKRTVSRAEELGIGKVRVGNVQEARK